MKIEKEKGVRFFVVLGNQRYPFIHQTFALSWRDSLASFSFYPHFLLYYHTTLSSFLPFYPPFTSPFLQKLLILLHQIC